MPGRVIPGRKGATVGLQLDPHYKFTRRDVINYAGRCGIVAAMNWMLLISPDRFDGDWQKVYDELERYWKKTNGGKTYAV